MATQLTDRRTFMEWLREPKSLIGLSAVLLSLCGLGIALYEASVIRAAQRASVWPHVTVAAAFSDGGFRFGVFELGHWTGSYRSCFAHL